jgi:hypothetical protein
MGDGPDGEDHVFIVRAWREVARSCEGGEEWRGRIDHLNSGRRAHFVGLAGLQETLVSLLRGEDGRAPAKHSVDPNEIS